MKRTLYFGSMVVIGLSLSLLVPIAHPSPAIGQAPVIAKPNPEPVNAVVRDTAPPIQPNVKAATPTSPTITLPSVVNIRTGRLKVIRAVTSPKSVAVKFFCQSADMDLIPFNGPAVLITTDTPGTYTIIAYFANGDLASDPAVCTVNVTERHPTPPGPGPGPTPGPVDAFTQALIDAFKKETDTAKASQVSALAEVYKQASAKAQDSSLSTIGDLFAAMAAGANAAGVKGKILLVQAVIQADLQKTLPSSTSATLDNATRTLAATEFAMIATALGNVK